MQAKCMSRSAPPAAPRRLRSKTGFSLTEVMISFTVMAMVVCGSLGALISGYRSLDTARCSTLAAQLMQSRIETLRMMNWEGLSTEASRDIPTEELKTLVPADAADVVNRFSLRQDVQYDAPRAVRTVVLTVKWNNVRGNPHERKFTMRYAKNGLYDYYVSSSSNQ